MKMKHNLEVEKEDSRKLIDERRNINDRERHILLLKELRSQIEPYIEGSDDADVESVNELHNFLDEVEISNNNFLEENQQLMQDLVEAVEEHMSILSDNMSILNSVDDSFGNKKKAYMEVIKKNQNELEKILAEMTGIALQSGSIKMLKMAKKIDLECKKRVLELNNISSMEGASGQQFNQTLETPYEKYKKQLFGDNGMKPDRVMPRDLPETQYSFTRDNNGILTYDSPMELDKFLYSSQGSAYRNFQGTCGLCSCANILRMAGVNIDEKIMIDYAANTTTHGIGKRLCSVYSLNSAVNGATGPKDRQAILEHFGVSSGIFSIKMDGKNVSNEALEDIANYVADGRGVILSVLANKLEPEFYGSRDCYHAVTVTSVTKNSEGDITGFYICDSNLGTRYYNAQDIKNALSGNDMNVTYSYIR